MPMRTRQNFGINPGNGQPGTRIGKRIFPDLSVPPDQLPANDDRGAYGKAKVVVTVYDQPNSNLTVYLCLFDPDDSSSKTRNFNHRLKTVLRNFFSDYVLQPIAWFFKKMTNKNER
ncbi:MAG: hypothetical protein RMK18_10385 [Armatimonadota bacterium]|nr:hypothetical protein [Armatimonadota bacterium]